MYTIDYGAAKSGARRSGILIVGDIVYNFATKPIRRLSMYTIDYVDTRNNDIKIEKSKAQRLVSLILREEKKLAPDEANALSLNICNRLQAAMSMPTKPGLRGYKMISRFPPYPGEGREEYVKAVCDVVDADDVDARALWSVVYSFGRNLPDDVVV